MNRRKACLLIAASPVAASSAATVSEHDDRPWIGPEYWSNPLQDWRLHNGRIECFVAGGDRNVFLLTHEVTDQPGVLSMRVRLGRLEEDQAPLGRGFAGFRAGIHGRFNDYRDSAVYGIGLNAGLAPTDGCSSASSRPALPVFPSRFKIWSSRWRQRPRERLAGFTLRRSMRPARS